MTFTYEEEFNTALGKRLTMLRRSRKMSLDCLGERIGVRGQQVHKYETGENRVPPERLAACARIFGVPVGFFFGEGECGQSRRFDKSVMHIAAEMSNLPPEIRQGLYALSRIINKSWEEKQQAGNDNREGKAA